ncbi:conserved hypothetical protein [Nostocoides japonicum T1-X7]|uniref:3-methyladenine DNA glycosylase n=1 Tax=Nostocoides japonicum T1-X7 TaxID=1194083 RepID=A0A077M905_9MICO|nr:conserved hypothetical protein [Tetrasphaera japonica T1-X7]
MTGTTTPARGQSPTPGGLAPDRGLCTTVGLAPDRDLCAAGDLAPDRGLCTTVGLARAEWQRLEAAHEARVDALTAGHRTRRAEGRAHPVEDFLFVYYRHSPGRLRRWHPGPGVVLEEAAGMPRAGWAHYVTDGAGVRLDLDGFLRQRRPTVDFVRDLLSRTASRPAQLGCFGLHEWAMVHRASEEEVRHAGWPLRLGRSGTDEVVESHRLRCTHADAYRFFTPSAAPLNATRPLRATQLDTEQPGCLHAAMDLYKWAFKLTPLVPSELTADCFELARELRELDMRASPYDLRELGYEPLPVETPEGKAAYIAAQRDVARRGNALRARLLAALAP